MFKGHEIYLERMDLMVHGEERNGAVVGMTLFLSDVAGSVSHQLTNWDNRDKSAEGPHYRAKYSTV